MDPEVDLPAFADAHAAGAHVVDVREPHEYVRGHVPGAQLIPLRSLPGRLHELPSEGDLFLICASGVRSLDAALFLAQRGRPVRSVRGGTLAWARAGHPIVAGAEAGPR